MISIDLLSHSKTVMTCARSLMRFIALLILIFGAVACSTPDLFKQSYDHYFPKNQQSLEGDYRRSYDDYLFGSRPDSARHEVADFYDAFHGDVAAAHRFFHSPDREDPGEYSEAWVSDCFLLLLHLGDDRFAALLQNENQETRESVGGAVENFLDPSYHDYPKTRSFYKIRSSRAKNRSAGG